MQVEIDRKALLDGLTRIAGIVDKGLQPEICQLALVTAEESGRIQVTGTDLRLTTVSDCPGSVVRHGALTFDPGTVLKLLKAISREKVNLTLRDNGHVDLQAGPSKYQVVGLPAVGYPKIVLPDDSAAWQGIPSLILAQLIDHAGVSMDKDEKRQNLNGLIVHPAEGKTRAASIDGHRLTIAETGQIQGFPRMFIPRKAVIQIRGFLDPMGQVQVSLQGDWLYLRYGGRMIGVRLYDPDLPPDYEQLLLPCQVKVMVPRDGLAGALKRLLAVMDSGKGIRFEFSQGLLRLKSEASSAGVGEEEIPCVYSGRDRVIGLAGGLLSEILGTFQCDQIALELQEADGEPVILKPNTPGAFYQAMIQCMRV